MDLSRYKRANDHEVERWLDDVLSLTPYQKDKMRREEIIRFSKFNFYKRKEEAQNKFQILWRLTAPVYLLYCLLLILFVPIKWMITGDRYFSRNFLDNFHYKWQYKMNW